MREEPATRPRTDPGIELARRVLREFRTVYWPLQQEARVAGSGPAPDHWLPVPEGDAPQVSTRCRARARVLGCPQLLDVDGLRVTGLRETALELLVYLVVHREGAPIERVLRDVYPAASPPRASERFSTDLANLRARLRAAANAARDVNPVPRLRGQYRLRPDLLVADWWQVLDDRRLLEAAGDHDVQAALHRLAAAFADGVLADGAGYEWLADVQEQSRRLGVAAQVRIADLMTSRDGSHAAAALSRACELDPFDEDLARRAITAYLEAGDLTAARRRCLALQDALADIDERPAQETLDLLLLDREPRQEVGQAGVSAADLKL